MSRPLDADVLAPARAVLPVPYAGGVGGGVIPIVAGSLQVTTSHRHPVLLLRLRRPLVDERLVASVVVGGVAQPDVVFGTYSHEGTTLPVVAPETSADLAGPFTVEITVRHQAGDAAFSGVPPGGSALPAEDVADLLEGRLITGVLGKLAIISTLEKQRVVAQTREVAASRSLELARRSSLDVMGVELGVPRRTDIDETDDDYRTRLAIFRQFRLPTPGGVAAALNGPGGSGDANAGLPSRIGVTHRFDVIEQINPLSVALKLVGVGNASTLADLHRTLRNTHLVDLQRRAPAELPPARRLAWEADRTVIRSEVTVPTGGTARYLHPGAARCLAVAVRLIRGAGITTQVVLTRAHDPRGGSVFELGLGLALTKLSATQLGTLVDRVADLSGSGRLDAATASVAAEMLPRPVEADPLGEWFFRACGFATVIEHSTQEVLLSPFPMHGLSVDGPDRLDPGATARLRARYVTASTGGIHVLAAQAQDRVPGAVAAGGITAPSATMNGADLTVLVGAVAAAPPDTPRAFEALVDAGVLVRDSAAHARALISSADLDLAVGFLWKAADVAALGSGDRLVGGVSGMSKALIDAGFSSVIGLWDTGNDALLLLASVTQLPGSLSVPGEPPAAAYWWTEAAVSPTQLAGQQHPLAMSPDGPTAVRVHAKTHGIGLVAVVGYHRVGLADPYEVRIALEDPAALLTAEQYGYIMNLLGALYPIGIEINTFDLRRHHVDSDGDGRAEWLTSRASRSYHQYRQIRWSRRSADRKP